MRRGLLLIVLIAAACSRPATQAYSEAWDAYRQGKLEQAQTLVDAALKSHRTDPAEALQPLRLLQAEILLTQGQARSAHGLLAALSDPRDPLLHLRWLVDRAEAAYKLEQGDQATVLLDEVDRTAGDNRNTEPVLKGRLLRGAILARFNRLNDADRVLEETAAVAAAAGDTFNQAAALLNLSFSRFKRQRYDESINYGLRALDAAGKAHASRLAGLANNNLGIAYTVLRDVDRAEEHLNKAIVQLREIGDKRNLDNAIGNLGNVHLQIHELDAAVRDFEEAAQIAKSIEAISDAARWAGQLSLAFTEQKKWAEADSWNRQASAFDQKLNPPENRLYLKLNAAAIANGSGNRDEAVRLYRELIDDPQAVPYLRWNSHVRLGSLLANDEQFDAANREYERGIEVLEQVWSSLFRDDYRLTYHDAVMEFFKDYVDLLVKEGHEEQALQVAESSRARLLIEKLGLRNSATGQGRPSDFQQYARRNSEVLLSYWLAPNRSFVWAVTPRGIHMKILPGQKEIEDLIGAYQKSIVQDLRDPVEAGMPQAERLSQILLGPVQADLAGALRVVVVPDGGLHALNLETLPEPGTSRYWIEDAELSLAPSLSMLAETPPRPGTKASLLLIGAPDAVSADYPELSAAKSEIDAIHARFISNEQVVRTGAAATPGSFLDSMPGRFSMIHFAAHAETNSQRPLESAIILSSQDRGFKLYARDIMGLKLSAELVTISACRSAGARTYAGEGLVGFTWAFLQSGARSVIAGLWDVSDLASSKLIGTLYEKLASGAKPAAALRQAKLALLHSGPFRKPFYWAPYQTYIR